MASRIQSSPSPASSQVVVSSAAPASSAVPATSSASPVRSSISSSSVRPSTSSSVSVVSVVRVKLIFRLFDRPALSRPAPRQLEHRPPPSPPLELCHLRRLPCRLPPPCPVLPLPPPVSHPSLLDLVLVLLSVSLSPSLSDWSSSDHVLDGFM